MTKLIAIALLAFAAPVDAQDMPMAHAPAPVCPKDSQPIPPALSAWSTRTPNAAVAAATELGKAAVVPGTAYDVSLAPTPAVTYPVVPTHPGATGSRGGLVRVAIATAGTYRVAIGAAAWLDMVQGTTTLPSVGHSHGPTCSGIRKMVDFALRPGSYTLQIVGNAEATLPLLIVRLP
jgi:hypothetical protein